MTSMHYIEGRVRKVDVYRTLKEAIQFLELEPGSMINEAKLAEELGVSRTPIREAMLRLADERLVDIYPQRGTYITKIDLNLAQEMALMRHILETHMCLELCRQKADLTDATAESMYFMKQAVARNDENLYLKNDNAFHRAIFKYANHELIWDEIVKTRVHYFRLLVLDMAFPDILAESYGEHERIIECIAKGDEAGLNAIMDVHHDHYDMKRREQIKAKYSSFIK